MKPETTAEHIRNALQLLQPELLPAHDPAAVMANVNGARRRLWLALAADPLAHADALQARVYALEAERVRLRTALARLRERDASYWARRLRHWSGPGERTAEHAAAADYLESLAREHEQERMAAEAALTSEEDT